MRLPRHNLGDQHWLGIAGPIALGVLTLGCVVSLCIQTWVPLIISAGLMGVILAGTAAVMLILDRAWRSPPAWECPHCRYDRRGLTNDAACPECGR